MQTETVTLPCSKCGGVFGLDCFYAATGNHGRHHRHSWCKPCVIADNREKRQALTGSAKAEWDERNRGYSRSKKLRRYGLTIEQYEAMFAAQGGVCAICRLPERNRQPHRKDGKWVDPLAIDHDHATGKVRGLLCMLCNTAIGKFGDDPVMLRQAADYLERGQS